MQHIEHEFWSWLIFFSLSPPIIECHRKLVLQRGPQCHCSIKHIHLSIQIKYQKVLYSPVGKGTSALLLPTFSQFRTFGWNEGIAWTMFFLLQYIHHSSVSQTSVVMLTKLCRYFCNSLGSPWIRIRKTTSQNEHPPCQAREPAHAFCGSHCVYAKFDCVALCKEKSIIGFRARKWEKIFAKLQTHARVTLHSDQRNQQLPCEVNQTNPRKPAHAFARHRVYLQISTALLFAKRSQLGLRARKCENILHKVNM